MTLAIRLAARGQGKTSPNPMVGAVVLSKGRIVGQGYHHGPGQPHAEILALKQAGPRAKGGTLYVTLEPCSHLNKRTPPCVPAVLQSGVRRVVVAMVDPNPAVRGRGVAQLRRAGLAVTVGVCRQEAESLNRAYAHWIKTGRPYVVLKAGMTLDGKIATAGGESQWITGPDARKDVHRLRSQVDGVLVGVGTVLQDNPSLTARIGGSSDRLATRQPLRIVVDSRLRTPLRARVLAQQGKAKTLIATTARASRARARQLSKRHVDMVTIPGGKKRVSLAALFPLLGRLGLTSILIEGGSTINAAVLRAKLVDHVVLYVAPTLLGGQDAKAVIGARGPKRLAQALPLKDVMVRRLGNDLVVEGDL